MANGHDSVRTLYVCESNLYREATPEETLVAAHQAIAKRFRRGATLSSPQLVREYLRITFATLEHEVFCVLLLDTHHRLLSFQEMFRGTLDSAAVFPREIVKEVLKYNAGAVILAHSVAGHRMIVMCPVSICGLRLLEAITTPILLSGGPHNGRLQRRRRVHVR